MGLEVKLEKEYQAFPFVFFEGDEPLT